MISYFFFFHKICLRFSAVEEIEKIVQGKNFRLYFDTPFIVVRQIMKQCGLPCQLISNVRLVKSIICLSHFWCFFFICSEREYKITSGPFVFSSPCVTHSRGLSWEFGTGIMISFSSPLILCGTTCKRCIFLRLSGIIRRMVFLSFFRSPV